VTEDAGHGPKSVTYKRNSGRLHPERPVTFLRNGRSRCSGIGGQILAEYSVEEETEDLEVHIDPSHLHQVVWNLCDNAIRYGEARDSTHVEIKSNRLSKSNRPYLEVADRGTFIDAKAADRIFEPFFTGRKGGTGLGLFIARELSLLNRAVLLYEPHGGDGSNFRIVFSDPQRCEE